MVQKGLWSSNEVLRFQLGADLSRICSGDEDGVSLPVTRLDDALEELNIPAVSFVKMDIEGAEIEALKGCARIMTSRQTAFAIASYHQVHGRPTSGPLEAFFREQGYQTETSYPQHPTTYAWTSGPRNGN